MNENNPKPRKIRQKHSHYRKGVELGVFNLFETSATAEENKPTWFDYRGYCVAAVAAQKLELYPHNYLAYLNTIDIAKFYEALKLLPRKQQRPIFASLNKACTNPNSLRQEQCSPITLRFSQSPHDVIAYTSRIQYRYAKLVVIKAKDCHDYTDTDWTLLGRVLCVPINGLEITTLTTAQKIWALENALTNYYNANPSQPAKDVKKCLAKLKSQQTKAAAKAAKLAAAEEKKQKDTVIKPYSIQEAMSLATLLTSFLELKIKNTPFFCELLKLQDRAV